MQDFRYALRSWRRQPAFAASVTLVLALGIGAATIVFDLFNLFFWRPLPVPRPGEVVAIYTAHAQTFIGRFGALSWPDFVDYREAAPLPLVGYRAIPLAIDTGNGREQAEVYFVSPGLFETLGLEAMLGRRIGAGDHAPGAEPVAVVSHALWAKLGFDPSILGRRVDVGRLSVTVVGVLPPGMRGLLAGSPVDLLLPVAAGFAALHDAEQERADRALHAWSVLARLPAGTSGESLRAQLAVVAEGLDREHPLPGRTRTITVERATLGHPIDRMRIGSTLGVFAAAVALLVLIACANVSSLLLAKGTGRQREIAIRQAVGASRPILMRQLLAESLLLAFAGGAGGLLLAFAARRTLVVYFGAELVADLRFDQRVLGLSLVASLVAMLLFGLAPALASSRCTATSLRGAAVAGPHIAKISSHSVLASFQVALALVLLVCCALLVQDLWRARRADLGFESAGLLIADLQLEDDRTPDQARAFLERLRERLLGIPGVTAAGTSQRVPPMILDVTVQLQLPEAPGELRRSRFDVVDTEYFEALGLPLLEGRLFEPRDVGSGRGVVVVDRLLAEQLWPGRPALGRVLRLARPRPGDFTADYEVVGIVGSVTQFALAREREPIAYFFSGQRHRGFRSFVLRAAGAEPSAVFASLRHELAELDPSLSWLQLRTHDELRWEALFEQRLRTRTLGLFAASGLLLAVFGIFAVVSYAVTQRRREIGIRMAIGATQHDLRRWVLARGAGVAAAGVAIGVVASVWAVQLLRGAVPGLGSAPPAIVAGAAILVVAAAIASSWIPARRAAQVDPIGALRQG